MPKQEQFTKELIIKAGIEIVRTEGIEALSARSLSGKMGCSVAPLFYKYANMEELLTDVRKAAGKIATPALPPCASGIGSGVSGGSYRPKGVRDPV